MRIGMWLPDLEAPSGGVSFAYRCARYLSDAGHEVVLVHQRQAFSYQWESPGIATVESVRAFRRRGADVLVVPEIFTADRALDGAAAATIVLNQNPFLTGGAAADATYRASSTLGVVATSAYTEDYLRLRFPDVRLVRASVGVDPAFFRPEAPPVGRRWTTAWMPRKRSDDAALVFAAVPADDDWESDPIDGVPVWEVAQRLARSAIFLSLSEREGFGLPVAEAMASGTPCVGFTGVGGRELLTPETGWPVEEGDVAGLIAALIGVRQLVASGDPELQRRTTAARLLISERHTRDHERGSLLTAFVRLLDLS